MFIGTVKWFNDCKGYGFIKNAAGEEVFVHYSTISGEGYRTLREGEGVEFDFEVGPKGLLATKVIKYPSLVVVNPTLASRENQVNQ